MLLPDFTAFFGVDFSGAKLAGRNAWVARHRVDGSPFCTPTGHEMEAHGWATRGLPE